MEVQELVARARILFRNAPKRFRVFELVNGRRSTKEISRLIRKPRVATLHDLQAMRDMELIFARRGEEGGFLKKDRSLVYEKSPLMKHLSLSYFRDPTRLPIVQKRKEKSKRRNVDFKSFYIPSEKEILDICKSGEDQVYEFKRAGGEIRDITKEISAFANTKTGGLLFYGVEDDGTVSGSDMKRQKFDERLQGSIRSNISPSLVIKIVEREVLGHKIIVIAVPPWNKKNVYQMDGRVYIRKGTIKTVASPEELKTLHRGNYIV